MNAIELESPDAPQPKPTDPESYALERSLISLIQLGAATSHRSQQHVIGISEIGRICERQIAYKLNDTEPSNLTDPLRALVGTGWHLAMKEMFTRLDAGSGRFLVEHDVRFRGIPGTYDLYDRMTRTLIDWKTVLLAKLKSIRYNGPQSAHVVQLQTYAATLIIAGEKPIAAALAYVPVDGVLDELHVWRTGLDPSVADKAVDRVNAIDGRLPSTVNATYTDLCSWCDYYQPESTDIDAACPGDPNKRSKP